MLRWRMHQTDPLSPDTLWYIHYFAYSGLQGAVSSTPSDVGNSQRAVHWMMKE